MNSLALATSIFLASYALILSERLNRALIAMLGAGLLIVFGVLTQHEAIEAIDFNTIGLLLGMMVIVTVTKETGLFQYVALKSAHLVKAHPAGLMLMFGTVTALCSAMLDNVTTVMMLTPMAFALTERLKVRPWPFLITIILTSNIGGTATLVGDPPNIMIGSAAHLPFNAFLDNLAPLSLIILVVTLALLLVVYRKDFHATAAARKAIMNSTAAAELKNPILLTHCLIVLAIVMAAFLTHALHGLEPASIAMGGAVLLLLLSTYNHSSEAQHHRVQTAVAEAEWVTLLFFVGLFVLVHGLVATGAITILAQHMLALTGPNMHATAMVILWGSAVLSAIVDNIPFVATMIPIVHTMAPTFGGDQAIEPLWWALAAGACLGGNGSLVGASANLVVAGLASRHKLSIGFVEFLKVGVPFTALSLAISHIYIMLRYF
ncbi:MAG: hypothetical protein GC129_01785 [Proteobacteria bacterium]|nr:hypothetical protein [Pseudomonadota bacterium]